MKKKRIEPVSTFSQNHYRSDSRIRIVSGDRRFIRVNVVKARKAMRQAMQNRADNRADFETKASIANDFVPKEHFSG